MLDVYAGPVAREAILVHGFKQGMFNHFLGASGGPKWFVLYGLDCFLFGEFFKSRTTPLNLLGSSAGAFRAACLCQNDPVKAITTLAYRYAETEYSEKPSAREISTSAQHLLNQILDNGGLQQILDNPVFHAHFLVNKAMGLAASNNRLKQSVAMFKAIIANQKDRKKLAKQFERHLFSSPLSQLQIDDKKFNTYYHRLNQQNLSPSLLASGSIPTVMSPVLNIPGAPNGYYWDGGVIDYHFDFDIEPSQGLILYPHFDALPKPGWFDKYSGRIAQSKHYQRTVLMVPSAEFIAQLPGAKIPDRKDFTELSTTQRIAGWKSVLQQSHNLASQLKDIINHPTTSNIKPLPF